MPLLMDVGVAVKDVVFVLLKKVGTGRMPRSQDQTVPERMEGTR